VIGDDLGCVRSAAPTFFQALTVPNSSSGNARITWVAIIGLCDNFSKLKSLKACFMKNIFTAPIFLTLCACSTIVEGPPIKGMKFRDLYPASFGGGIHAGLDLDVPLGTKVKSIADGTVTFVNSEPPYVFIKHPDGISAMYYHVDGILVKSNQSVKKGEVIAATAMTGKGGPNTSAPVPYPHLHLELTKESVNIDPESIGMSCEGQTWTWPVGCEKKPVN